jgi:hypothetical protein
MSFNKKLNGLIEDTIKDFISTIGDKYDLDPNELYKVWSSEDCTSPVKTKKLFEVPKATDELDHTHLLSCKVPELKAMCKQRKLKCSGTKSELMSLLLGNKSQGSISSSKKSPVKKSVVSKVQDTEKPIIKKLISTVSTIPIRRNQFNNHEHPETSLVFDVKTKKVYGKQQDDGSISTLTQEDIENCNKFKFDYVIPENIENKEKIEDEKVDELDDDEDEDDEFIESEEEIEEEDLIDDDFDDDDVVYE